MVSAILRHSSVALTLCLACGDSTSNNSLSDAREQIDACVKTDDPSSCGADPSLPRLLGSWGGRGTEPGQFIEPSSVELHSDGTVIVAGHENRVQRFTRDGELLDIFGIAGPDDGQFNHPHGLAVDRLRDDRIYVGDQENHRLQVFDSESNFIRGWGDAGFAHIHDVGIDPLTGNVFVGDYELHTLRAFSPEGLLQFEIGGLGRTPGFFNGVWGISTDSEGFVYVADTFNRRIQKFDRQGNFVLEWAGFKGTDFVKPTGVFVDSEDTVYICDSKRQTISLFRGNGAPVTEWQLADILGATTEPEDIVIDEELDHLYIAEVLGHRVYHLQMP
jgi:DNA-binding beta-propeller fold protein YncE